MNHEQLREDAEELAQAVVDGVASMADAILEAQARILGRHADERCHITEVDDPRGKPHCVDDCPACGMWKMVTALHAAKEHQ